MGRIGVRPSDRPYVGGLLALRALDDVELDGLALVQGAIAVAHDGGEVNEDVVSVGAGDEPVPFLVAEPFHGALRGQARTSLPFPAQRTPDASVVIPA